MLILSNMKSAREIVPPKRGYPSLKQVQNCVKYLRRHQGTKNTLYAVRQAVERLKLCVDDPDDTPFVFGAREDENGVPYDNFIKAKDDVYANWMSISQLAVFAR
ncbi:hypothetical protein ATCC90586_005039 [Pythium insidiosum]|nr:hypothetical protein ATCC90586_005039 [Pythium insidiosum]